MHAYHILFLFFDDMLVPLRYERDGAWLRVPSTVRFLPLLALPDDSVLPLSVKNVLGHVAVAQNLANFGMSRKLIPQSVRKQND